ncbi:hypothetical protein [Marinigracilibium pacificum]|uniref:SpoIIAA-like protein n=1 Tax=Marinigracilibium pacificum TaxID=2729599 RepID=A0A848ISN0_9BACT|nr:hypothetical protein [Marinigracilibium pacificum]NMM47347.1 hypothetical protein [Marinigracilibium pacificum]
MIIEFFLNEDNVIFKEKYVTTFYSEELKLVGIVWDGIFNKDEYINVFERLLDFAKTNKVVGVYSDIRKQGVVPTEARKYFEKNISHKAKELGVDKTGIVSDSSPFKKYYLNTLIKMTGRPAKICSNPEDAINYLVN